MKTVPAKTIVTNAKNDFWFGAKYNMNIYRGCCHGCIYCDSRSECYHVENFDEVCAKEDALRIIRDDLRRKKVKGVVGTGAMSDPYNPFEEKEQLTRHALELINAYGFGLELSTKSDLVTRDIDILKEIKEHSPVLINMTITTVDDELCKIIEPNVCVSSKRFEALKKISDAGIDTCILMMPILPWITDSDDNIKELVKRAHECGVKYIYSGFGVTLRMNQRDYYYEKLDKYFPGLKDKYQKKYRDNYSCAIPTVKTKYKMFVDECKKYGIITDMKQIIRGYQSNYKKSQLSIFDDINKI
ncbi:SPL family radical SAM protein [Anaerorhabdus sp.]|uniref:SPL family radical SAM protein n=1 Tax=Anaerorhabdus sp. TaxID=1872524 RepID=UPI002FC58DF2